jgi:hypothetical protein
MKVLRESGMSNIIGYPLMMRATSTAAWAELEWESPTLEGSKLDSKPPPAADECAN